MFRSRRARPVWGVALSRVSDQSTIRRPLTVGLFPADLQATLGIFTGNARNGRSTPSCGCGLFWRGRTAMPRLTRTCGTATARWRNRLASRSISRGPRRCHDAGHRGRAARCVLKQTTYESLKIQSQLGTTNQRREDRGCVAFGGAVPRHSRGSQQESQSKQKLTTRLGTDAGRHFGLASASRPLPASGVRHTRVGRLSCRKGAPSEAPTTWLPSVNDGAVKCGLGARRGFPT
jgi:hypothetical protein